MRELLQGVVYRPLSLPLAMLVWAIVASACCGLTPLAVLFFSLLLALIYLFFLTRFGISPRPGLFLLLLFFSLLLAGTTARRITRCRKAWTAASVRLGEKGRTVTFAARIEPFPQGSYRGWRLELRPLDGPLAGLGSVVLRLPRLSVADPRLPRAGDRVTVAARLRPLKPARHPFLRAGFRRSLLSGVVAEARLNDLEKLRIHSASRNFWGWIEGRRRELESRIFAALGEDNRDAAAILAAVLLGSRDRLEPRIRDLFLDFGVYHLFAISGLHLGIIVALLFGFGFYLTPGYIRRRRTTGALYPAALLTLALLPFYILLTGCHLPVLRAGIMAGLFLLALLRGRRQDPFSTLMLAALVILWLWPQELFGLSFQLSFTAVATILWLLPLLPGWWRGWTRRLPPLPGPLESALGWLFPLALTSLAISVATLPWLLRRVHFVSPYSLPANLILIPLFSLLIIPGGMAGLAAGLIPGGMELLLRLPAAALNLVLAAAGWARTVLPGRRLYGSVPTTCETLLMVAVILMVAALLSARPGRRKGLAVMLLFLLLAGLGDQLSWLRAREAERVAVAAFVGRRPQALLVEMRYGQALLFNGGSWPGGFSLAEQVIAPYCWRRKITEIPVLVLTEPQKGLVGGLLFLVEHFRVREIWYHGIWSGYPPFRDFNRITRDRFGVRWRKLASLSAPWMFNGIEISVVGPPANDFVVATSRSRSLLEMAPSLLFSYGKLRLLVWGGGQVAAGKLPEEVDILALLADPGKRLPEALRRVRLKPGSWLLEPGRSRAAAAFSQPGSWAGARVHRTRRDGFVFLAADRRGEISKRLPAELISGCQVAPE